MPDRTKVDIYYLADTTGSMGNSISNVKEEIKSSLEAMERELELDIGAGLAWYKDLTDGRLGIDAFYNELSITRNYLDVENAACGLTVEGGGDQQEAQIYALYQLAKEDFLCGWRDGAKKIVVWLGDEDGHEPINAWGHTLNRNDVIRECNHDGIKVLAFSVGANNLNGTTNQAREIAEKTGGDFYDNVNPSKVIRAIYDAIRDRHHRGVL